MSFAEHHNDPLAHALLRSREYSQVGRLGDLDTSGEVDGVARSGASGNASNNKAPDLVECRLTHPFS
jgi:hypothetical protein